MLAQSKEIDRLRDELAKANEKLENQEIKLANAGSIAEASLSLTKAFEESQRAADLYFKNVKQMNGDMKKDNEITLPTTSEIEELYKKAKYRKLFTEKIRSTVFMLIVVVAFAILVAMLYLPTLRIYGKSMKGMLESGDIVLAVKSNHFKIGDIVAFYYNNNILVKRVIAESGDWVNITKDGTDYVNDKKINEPYIENKAYGEITIKFPY